MMQTKHRNPPRPWAVGVTCLLAFSVFTATLIILRMYMHEAGETASLDVWFGTTTGALVFGGIFLRCCLDFRRWKHKDRKQLS
jgi:hypothetical protein